MKFVEEVERRMAKRTGVSLPAVKQFMAAYADEYVRLARERNLRLSEPPVQLPAPAPVPDRDLPTEEEFEQGQQRQEPS